MNKKIIAVDIDEVLSETLKAILENNKNQVKKKNICREDFVDYDLRHINKLGITQRQALLLFARVQIGSGLFNKIKPVQWAKKNILELKGKGYKFYAVTARFSILKLTTNLWINKNFKGCFEGVICTNFYTKYEKKKSDVCKEIGAGIIIEDNLKTCIDCAEQGIKCYLFDKPWNRDVDLSKYPLIKRIYSRNEIDL